MALAFLFLAMTTTTVVSQADDVCFSTYNNKGEVACLKGNGTWNCNYCKSAAVPSSCHVWDVAKHLPAPSFLCGNATRDCSAFATNDTCAENVGCGWCASATVPASCKGWALAAALPPSVFDCTGPY